MLLLLFVSALGDLIGESCVVGAFALADCVVSVVFGVIGDTTVGDCGAAGGGDDNDGDNDDADDEELSKCDGIGSNAGSCWWW